MTEKKLVKAQQALEREQAKSRLFMELTRHIGKGRVIGMGELYQKVFQEPWEHRINDTRQLRKLITDLRTGKDGPPQPICSSCCAIGPGYYLAQTGPELQGYIARIEKQALRKLGQAARLRRIPLAKLLGQLALELGQAEEVQP